MDYRGSEASQNPEKSSRAVLEARPSTRVANALAARSGKSIDELRPLAESIDPEALDDIFADRQVESGRVSFHHEGFVVTVTGAGAVQVDRVDEE